MPFQKQVNMYPANGFSGSFASANHTYNAAVIAGEDIPIGRFVNVGDLTNPQNNFNPARAYLGGEDAIGIVNRIRIGVIKDLKQESSDVISKTMPIEITISGDLHVQLINADMTQVARRMKLFYRIAESENGAGDAGEIQAGAAGSTISGFKETNWSVIGDVDQETGMVKASTARSA